MTTENPQVSTTDAPRAAWHWCSSCKLASAKPGNCPGCGSAYDGVPERGVPDTAFSPRIPGGRSRVAMVISALAAVLLVGVVSGTIATLAAHGQRLSTSSSQASGGTGGDGMAMGGLSIGGLSMSDGRSTFRVSSLRGTLRLPGDWVTLPEVAASLHGSASPVAAGAAIKTEVSVASEAGNVGVVSFATSNPIGVLNKFVSTMPQESGGPGQRVTISPTRDVTVAGFTAVAEDFEARTSGGGMLARGTLYVVNAGDHVVMIRTTVLAAQVKSTLPAIEKALITIR
jgi:hypothetical protein